MHDKRNPYGVYSIPARQWQEQNFRREVERQRQAGAAHQAFLSSLSSPAAIYKPAPVSQPAVPAWGGVRTEPSFPRHVPRHFATPAEASKKAFPWRAVWWLAGLVVMILILAS